MGSRSKGRGRETGAYNYKPRMGRMVGKKFIPLTKAERRSARLHPRTYAGALAEQIVDGIGQRMSQRRRRTGAQKKKAKLAFRTGR